MRFKLIAFLLMPCFIYCGCRNDHWNIHNLNNGKIDIIGHRGSGPQTAANPVPDNSLQSFKNALELYGADGIEMDVQMSSDGVPFLYHDPLLESHTNFSGCISDYTATDLRNCAYSNSDEKLITLEECIQYCLTLRIMPKLFLDTKPEFICHINSLASLDALSWYADHLHKVVDKYGIYPYAYVEAGNSALIYFLQRKSNRFLFNLNGLIPDHLPIVDSMGIYGMMLGNADVSAEGIALAHNHGVRISLFAVNDKQEAKNAIAKSPDYILTDDILLLKQLLDQ